MEMKIKVDQNDIRLDKFLGTNTEFSREYISKLIENEFVMVNGKVITKPAYKVKIDDEIEFEDGLIQEDTFEAEDIPLDIVYEDEYLMIINKPSGIVVHPGAGNKNHTLVNALKYHTDNLSDLSGEFRTGIVHRLDKDTSGLMLVAKTNKVHELLSDDFKHKRVKREYLALINGVFPSNKAKIDAPIGRSKTDFRKMEVCKDGKNAVTNLVVEKKYKNYTLVRLSLETGRTHQIRCHLAYIGYPVYNDPVYSKNVCTPYGQFLHSTSIDFIHPITKKEIHFECPINGEFKEFIDKLDKE